MDGRGRLAVDPATRINKFRIRQLTRTRPPRPGGKAGDIVSAETRSQMMRAVGQKATRPELQVRRLLRELGVGYRVVNRDLPGSPDVANRRRRWAIFVNGCFWHGHRNCAVLAPLLCH